MMDNCNMIEGLINGAVQSGSGTVDASSLYSFLQQLGQQSSTTGHIQPVCLQKDTNASSVQVYQKEKANTDTKTGDEADSSASAAQLSMHSTTLCAQDEHFNDALIWCEDCQVAKAENCQDHPTFIIADKRLLSFARQTLPTQFTLAVTPQGEHSLMCKKPVKARSRFGPLLGKLVKPDNAIDQDKYLFRIFTNKNTYTYLDTTDENTSNWMMFIRPAESYSQQNLVAYQHNGCIYFSVIKNIAPGTEMKVAYAESYAELMNVKTLKQMATEPAHEKKVEILDGFPCDHCALEFEEFEGLDSHICAVETAKLASSDKGTRTRNKRKGKPQKLSSLPKTKITAGDKKVSKPPNRAKVTSSKKIVKAPELFPCGFCGVVFNRSRRLDIHMSEHTGKLPFKCEGDNCEKSFTSKFKLDRHTLSHGSRKFSCNNCGKAFARKDNLQAHVIIHDSSRQMYKCEFNNCEKQYSAKSSYKIHIAFHQVAEGSLQCSLCLQLYENSETLLHHIKVHANSQKIKAISEKKFQCSICDKKFFAGKDRDRHVLTHTKEKKFECKICSMKFARSDHLKRHHVKIHENDNRRPARPRGRARGSAARTNELPDLSATELTKSIQQLIAETNLTMDNTASLQNSSDLTSTANPMHIAPILTAKSLSQAEPITIQATSSNQRINFNLQTATQQQSNLIKIPSTSSSWQTIPVSDSGQHRYVLSNDTTSSADPNVTMPRYYITNDNQGTTTLLLPAENPSSQPINLDSLQRTSGGLYNVDSNHALPSDSLSNDFTSDGMKVLSGLTPIFLNPDGSTTDNDFIPIVYHQPYSQNGQ